MVTRDINKRRATSRRSYNKRKSEDPEFLVRLSAKAREFNRSNMPRYLLMCCRSRAKQLNREFDLDVSDIYIPKVCPVLGFPFEFRHAQRAASVDRIDNTKGYVKGNIQIISRQANLMKNVATPEQLIEFSKWVQRTYQL